MLFITRCFYKYMLGIQLFFFDFEHVLFEHSHFVGTVAYYIIRLFLFACHTVLDIGVGVSV